jgi:benzoylformate decarboxylase
MEKMSGKKALLEMLKSEGVKHIFGNPGTSEGPIIDMLGDYPELKYFLTLQESVAIGMAESYARLTGKASFVSLHVDSGLANGIALMLDAYNTGTPMVVTSANYDVRKITENKTDLAELVRPVTKWAVELTHPEQIPSAIRRAFNEANSHPKGPVYVGFTSNCLEEEAEMNIIPSANIYSNYYPDPIALINASDLILQSKSILILTGDRVADDDAVNEVVQLAEILGSPVYQSRGAEVSFPTNHPQYFGIHSLRSKSSREIIKDFDLVITIGMDTFEELFY